MEVALADIGGEIITYSADVVLGFKVDELSYKSIKVKGDLSKHQHIFFEIIDENWILPIYARTISEDKSAIMWNDGIALTAISIAVEALEHEQAGWQRVYYLGVEGKGELKLKKIFIKNRHDGLRTIMFERELSALLDEECPDLALKVKKHEDGYRTQEFFRFKNQCK